ncbi:MAG: hypothetical protein JRI23_31925 [Deltaproteobacteria bacterium]|jgi:hypothetical protein|nr:hypothetical protein [Deltaproteobacteria bacterium]MBW2536833.1 hypothetical protein [Deltaproteobacteria bacterium]
MVSILVTFDSAEQLAEAFQSRLGKGSIRVDGAYEVAPGDGCEAVLVHPESGESLEISAEVVSADEESVTLRFGTTPLLRNRLAKFAGAGTTSANANERVRALSAADRRQMALMGELTERVALERAFGKEVWDPLLSNPKLTVGEVVRLARMGTMPLPLLEKIVSNNAWVRVPQVRRALLGNRRLEGQMIQRVLKLTPAAELRLIPKQTTYPQQVRTAAQKLLARSR